MDEMQEHFDQSRDVYCEEVVETADEAPSDWISCLFRFIEGQDSSTDRKERKGAPSPLDRCQKLEKEVEQLQI